MAGPFPNDQPLNTHDTIDLAEAGAFTEFEEELQNTATGQGQTKRDYEFRSAGNGRIIIAKPMKAGHLWATEITPGAPHQGVWVEGSQYDPSTGGIDDSQSPQQGGSPAVPAGTCPSCSATGVSGKFCNICGEPLAPGGLAPTFPLPGFVPTGQLTVPLGPAPVPTAGQLAPGQTPVAGAGQQSAPMHINPNRMEGKPKKELVVPEGMTRVAKSTGFADALDALLDGTEPDPAEQTEDQK